MGCRAIVEIHDTPLARLNGSSLLRPHGFEQSFLVVEGELDDMVETRLDFADLDTAKEANPDYARHGRQRWYDECLEMSIERGRSSGFHLSFIKAVPQDHGSSHAGIRRHRNKRDDPKLTGSIIHVSLNSVKAAAGRMHLDGRESVIGHGVCGQGDAIQDRHSFRPWGSEQMTSLREKTAMITGAAGDIGQALAVGFLQHGYHVILSDSRAAVLRERTAGLPSRENIDIIPADLAEADDVARLARDSLQRCGSVDVIVNNAAIQPDGDVASCDLSSFELCYAVNLRAPYLLCHALVPSMASRGGGSIINISSVHAAAPGPRRFAYATMKTALLGMTRSMATDLGHLNIRANAICPTATLTGQLRDAWSKRSATGTSEDLISCAARQHPLGRLAEVTDVAEAAIFLAKSHYINGIELRVDGGLLSALRLIPPADHTDHTDRS